MGNGRASLQSLRASGRHSFDAFVVGASNQFAHAAALAVAKNPGRHYNPLFLYGASGLGKTHLTTAIATLMLQTDPQAKIERLSSERFTTDLITAIRTGGMDRFKRRYRTVDALIVDDVHMLAGRDRSQEEFFHTFNALHDAGRQIVLASEKAPEEIQNLEERLRNRFQWGLVVDIQPPDVETMVAILGRRAAADGIRLSREAAMLLAERVPANVRSLEGTLTRAAAQASLDGVELSGEYVRNLIDRGELGRHGPVTFEEIAQAVCERYRISRQELLSRRRTKHVALPRQVAMYLCRNLLDASYPRIGTLFGRDHTTVLHGVRAITSRVGQDATLQSVIESIERRLAHGS